MNDRLAATLLVILIYDVRYPERAGPRLADVVAALDERGPMIATALCAAGGAYLVVDGLRALL